MAFAQTMQRFRPVNARPATPQAQVGAMASNEPEIARETNMVRGGGPQDNEPDTTLRNPTTGIVNRVPGAVGQPPAVPRPLTPQAPRPVGAPRSPVGMKPMAPVLNPPTPIPAAPPPPDGDLRSDVYTPGADPRLTAAQTATDQAGSAIQSANRQQMQAGNEDRYRSVFGSGLIGASGYAVNPDVRFRQMNTEVNAGSVNPNVDFQGVNTQVNRGGAVDPMESARTAKYGQAQDAALDGLNGPSRTELAQKTLADLEAQTDVQRQGAFRRVGQTAAKFGRLGMGAVNAELGSIEGDLQRDLAQKRNELARSVAEGDISDRFRRVDTTAGLRSMESGLDAGMRGERRTERDYGTGLDERNVGRAIGERDTALGLGERNVGRQFDERNFRANLDTDNLNRARDERSLESALDERNIGRRMSERDTRLGIDTGNEDRAFDRTRAALDFSTGQTDRGINDAYDRYTAAGSLEDRIYGQGRGNRDEFRVERDRQDRNARQTIEDRIRERELMMAEEDARTRRAMALAQAGGL